MTNGLSAVGTLSEVQLEQVKTLLRTSVSQLQELESQANLVRKAINDIVTAYLTGLGLPSEVSIDLATGVLTPIKAAST